MDLNERIAAWMGWRRPPRDDEHLHVQWIMPDGRESYNSNLPAYTTDHNAARLVLAEVKKRGLEDRFRAALWYILTRDNGSAPEIWEYLTATPEQICEAALKAGEVE